MTTSTTTTLPAAQERPGIQLGTFTTASVTSADGTVIRYRQVGRGPGVVMLHGAMESAASHMRLAGALADAFTVYLPERRGHALPGPFRSDYSIAKEVEDLAALLATTGAHDVFGVSAGGLICLQAALDLDSIRRVAVYEPALVVNHSASFALLPRCDREIREGRLAAALVTGLVAGQMGPPIFDRIPRVLLERMVTSAMRSEDRRARPGDVTMRMLAPTLHYDFALVAEMAESVERFRAVQADVLLLGGRKSPAYLRTALDSLERVLPRARRVEFAALDHGGSSDPSSTNRRGNPELVAQALRRFYA